ncbi:hypothetical protein D9M72_513030 [compost metagenome]
MSCERGAAEGIEAHVVVEPARQIGDRLDAQARGHQFDCQGNAVDLPGDLGQQGTVRFVERTRTCGLGPLDKQFDGGPVQRLRERNLLDVRNCKRGQSEDILARYAKRLTAGREDAQAGEHGKQAVDRRRQ